MASLNVAFFGMEPARPLLEKGIYMHDNCCPAVGDKPLHKFHDGKLLKVALTELRGDWKFYRAR